MVGPRLGFPSTQLCSDPTHTSEVLAEAKFLKALQRNGDQVGEVWGPCRVSPGLAGGAFAAGGCESPTSSCMLPTLKQDIIFLETFRDIDCICGSFSPQSGFSVRS